MKDVYRYGSEINSHDLVKILAITTMVIDHIGKFFFTNTIWFRIVGRMAAPQFFFLVGYAGSYRFRGNILIYGILLFIINAITNPSTSILEHIIPMNILVAFVAIKAFLNKYDVVKLPPESLLILLAMLLLFSLPTYILIEYGTLGLCYAIGSRLHIRGHRFQRLWLGITVLGHFFFEMTALLILNSDVPVRLYPYTISILAVLFMINLAIFLNYKFKVFNMRKKFIKKIAIYISRYSLEIYFFHLSTFMVISYIWDTTV